MYTITGADFEKAQTVYEVTWGHEHIVYYYERFGKFLFNFQKTTVQ